MQLPKPPQQTMADGASGEPVLTQELFSALQQMFKDFQARADRLDRAYKAMQRDFKKLNLTLEEKNRELAESLRKQEETQTSLNSILESMDNGVVGVDIVGTITHFNRAAAGITGFEVTQVLGRNYQDFFHDSSNAGHSLLQVLHTGKGLKHDEKVLWRKDGHPVPVSFQSAILRDQGNNSLGAVEVFTDISRIKALEEEMQQARTMAALGAMSATVAHEIRNPLGAMGMWAALLDRDLGPYDPRKKTLGKIIEGLSRLNKIVSNLLVYTRPARPDLRQVNLNELMNEIVDFMEIEIERQNCGITVGKCWDEDVPVLVMVDPEKMQQVVMNLCLNAVQAMPEGGTLTVHIDKGTEEHSGYSSFRIVDTGTGIDDEHLERIFDPFYTTKENGTGLGLAIVKKFVESHSGFIDVKSMAGAGTTIRVFLPSVPTVEE